jgi:hypothetical protein
MSLKSFYYSIENKWYDFVEKTGLYKITDKIDRVMPSIVIFHITDNYTNCRNIFISPNETNGLNKCFVGCK